MHCQWGRATLQTILKNGDLVNIETPQSLPSLHWLSSSATEKLVQQFEDTGKINLLKTLVSLKKLF